MGLMMGPALAFRYYQDLYARSESEHLTRAGAFMSAGWQAYLDRRIDRVMFRYADTVKELHLEIEDLRRQVVVLEQRVSDMTLQSQPPRVWHLLRRWSA
jgi:hypothetical protein